MEQTDMGQNAKYPDVGTEFYQDEFGERIISADDPSMDDAMAGDDANTGETMNGSPSEKSTGTDKGFRETLGDSGDTEKIDILEADLKEDGDQNPLDQDTDRSM